MAGGIPYQVSSLMAYQLFHRTGSPTSVGDRGMVAQWSMNTPSPPPRYRAEPSRQPSGRVPGRCQWGTGRPGLPSPVERHHRGHLSLANGSGFTDHRRRWVSSAPVSTNTGVKVLSGRDIATTSRQSSLPVLSHFSQFYSPIVRLAATIHAPRRLLKFQIGMSFFRRMVD